MKIYKITLLMGVLILSTNVLAITKSSVIPIHGGNATYGKYAFFETTKLLENVKYEVTCDITSNGISGQRTDAIQYVESADINKATVNGTQVHDQDQKNISTNKVNKLDIYDVTNGYSDPFGIHNLDRKDTIYLSNCFAKPQSVD